METTITQFHKEIADKLNADEWFAQHNVEWLPENSLDIEFEIKKHLNNTGICAVVVTPEMTYQGITDNGNYAFTINRLVLQIVENTTVNRGRPNADSTNTTTALEAVHHAFYTLAKTQSDSDFGVFTPSTIKQSTTNSGKLLLVEGTLQCTVVL